MRAHACVCTLVPIRTLPPASAHTCACVCASACASLRVPVRACACACVRVCVRACAHRRSAEPMRGASGRGFRQGRARGRDAYAAAGPREAHAWHRVAGSVCAREEAGVCVRERKR
eukprot:6051045-Pleurochrysis_carterae.AAC.1